MHADEIDTDEELVRALIASQFAHWSGLPVIRVASAGTDNAMYRIGTALVARLPRIQSAVANVELELRLLPRLAPGLPAAVPEPVGLGEPGAGYPWPWSIYRWLAGVNPVVGAVTEPVRLAGELAAFTSALRRLDPAGAPAAGRGVALATRDQPTRQAIAELRAVAEAGVELGTPADADLQLGLDDLEAVWSQALQLPEYDRPPAWSHGDLSPGNVLVDEAGRLAAVIDWSGAGIGDPSIDLLLAWNLLPAGAARAAYRDGLDVDEVSWLRGRAWALSVALIQLPYYRISNPALAASSRQVLGEVIAEWSCHH